LPIFGYVRCELFERWVEQGRAGSHGLPRDDLSTGSEVSGQPSHSGARAIPRVARRESLACYRLRHQELGCEGIRASLYSAAMDPPLNLSYRQRPLSVYEQMGDLMCDGRPSPRMILGMPPRGVYVDRRSVTWAPASNGIDPGLAEVYREQGDAPSLQERIGIDALTGGELQLVSEPPRELQAFLVCDLVLKALLQSSLTQCLQRRRPGSERSTPDAAEELLESVGSERWCRQSRSERELGWLEARIDELQRGCWIFTIENREQPLAVDPRDDLASKERLYVLTLFPSRDCLDRAIISVRPQRRASRADNPTSQPPHPRQPRGPT
jgi:hypothetical protein